MGSDITQVGSIFYHKSDNDRTHWKVFANKEAISGPAALKKAPEKCIFCTLDILAPAALVSLEIERKGFQHSHSSNSSKGLLNICNLQFALFALI